MALPQGIEPCTQGFGVLVAALEHGEAGPSLFSVQDGGMRLSLALGLEVEQAMSKPC